MKIKRLAAILLGMVMTVEAVPALVFAKEIDLSERNLIVSEEAGSEEEEKTESEETETKAKVKETQAPGKETESKEEETSLAKEAPETKTPAETGETKPSETDPGDKAEPEKEDKEPAVTEDKEPEETEEKVPSQSEPDEPAAADKGEETESDKKQPADAGEDDNEAKEQEGLSLKDGEVVTERGGTPFEIHNISRTPDNDEQLEAYFRKKAQEQVGKSQPLLRKAAPAGTRLSGNDLIAYNTFKSSASKIASGILTSSEIEIPLSEFGLSGKTWTAQDLGVSSVIEEIGGVKYVSQAASQALRAKVKIPIDIGAVDNALLADCPYELYWFDKTKGVLVYSYSIIAKNYGKNGVDDIRLSLLNGPIGKFDVSKDYANVNIVTITPHDDVSHYYTTNPSKISRVNTAVKNAAAYVSNAKSKTDYQKLCYYRDTIMSLVSYDHSAAGTGGVNYGDPWQIISVFDGNSKTNVVCEGYAKAFMYLCNLTSFSGDISCITATGDIPEGGHMWNIVNMDDGKNYIVDITNIDGRGTATNNYTNALFLAGFDSKITDGYVFSSDSGLLNFYFTYDEECFGTYTSDQLAISNQNYYIKRSVSINTSTYGTPKLDKTSAYPDEKVTITPNPAKGYELDTITVNGSPIGGNSFLMTGVEAKVVVTYRLKTYNVNLQVSEGGKVTASPDKGNYGTTVQLTVTPDKGYELDKITLNGETLEGKTFSIGESDAVVDVSFKKIPYTVTVKSNGHGTAKAGVEKACIGDKVDLTLTPDEGYFAKAVTVNGNQITGTSFTMLPEAVNVVVTFEQISQAAVGDILSDGINNYKVTNNAMDGTGTVAFAGSANQAATVSIPAAVTLKGLTYKVTKIASQAFYKNTAVTSVYIGANIVVIESLAFYGCTKLVKLNGGLRLKVINPKAVINCPKLKTFVITSAVLSKIGSYSFYGDKSLKTIYINKTTKLTKKGVKKSLKGSSVKTVKVKKSKVRKYKKYFTKKNAGRKVSVKK